MAFACTALLDATLFAVPKREKPLLSLRLFSLAGLRPARLCSTVQPSPFPARKSSAFAPAFLSSGVRPPRLCSMLHSSPFPARKASAFAPAFLSSGLRLHGSAFFAVASGIRPARPYFLRRCFRPSPCTALLDGTLFAVPKTEKPLLSLRLFSLAGVRPPRLCSTVQPSPFPARKNEVFSGCGRSPYKKIGHLPFESKLSSALTDLFARLSAYPKFLILNSFSASRF